MVKVYGMTKCKYIHEDNQGLALVFQIAKPHLKNIDSFESQNHPCLLSM